MTRRADIAASVAPIFVSADEGARRCMVGVETWRSWARSGVIPPAAVTEGQIVRWHWPSVESALAGAREPGEDDPFMKALADARQTPPPRPPRRRRHEAAP